MTIYVCEAVRRVEALHAPVIAGVATVREQLERQAQNLLDAHARKDAAACVQIGNWLPRLVGKLEDAILAAPFTLEDAQRTLAREHGYPDWEAVEATPFDPEFERAVDAVVSGDLETLGTLLARDRSLTRARSVYGHRATLLIYLAANGVEIRRQKSPLNAVAVAEVLLLAGADVKACARVYDGEYDTLALLETSAHPAEAGVRDDLRRLLTESA